MWSRHGREQCSGFETNSIVEANFTIEFCPKNRASPQPAYITSGSHRYVPLISIISPHFPISVTTSSSASCSEGLCNLVPKLELVCHTETKTSILHLVDQVNNPMQTNLRKLTPTDQSGTEVWVNIQSWSCVFCPPSTLAWGFEKRLRHCLCGETWPIIYLKGFRDITGFAP